MLRYEYNMTFLYIILGLLIIAFIVKPRKTFNIFLKIIILTLYSIVFVKNYIQIVIVSKWNSSYKKLNNEIVSVKFYNDKNDDFELKEKIVTFKFMDVNLRDIIHEICTSRKIENIKLDNFNENTRIIITFKNNNMIKKIVYSLTQEDICIEQKRIKSEISFNTFEKNFEKFQNVFDATITYDDGKIISIKDNINAFYNEFYTFNEKKKGVYSKWLSLENYDKIENIDILTEDLLNVSYTPNNQNILIEF